MVGIDPHALIQSDNAHVKRFVAQDRCCIVLQVLMFKNIPLSSLEAVLQEPPGYVLTVLFMVRTLFLRWPYVRIKSRDSLNYLIRLTQMCRLGPVL